MTNLVKAELLKWRTTHSLYAVVLGLVLIVALGTSGAIATSGHAGTEGLDTSEGLRTVFSSAVNGGFLMLIMGIMTTAGEYRHNTIASSLLITPHGSRLISAKAMAAAAIGVAMAVTACAVTVAIALPWLSVKDVHPSLLSADTGLVLLGAAAVVALYGLIGAGIGAIVRNQVAAIVGSLTWLLIVEQLLVELFPGVGKWLSFGASGSLIGSVDADLLPAAGAALLLVGYATASVAGGMRLTAKRDVTA